MNDQDEMEINWIDKIPWQYRDYQSLYTGEVSNVLLPPRWLDHAINIQSGKEPPLGPIFTLSENELSVLKKYIKERLHQGKIRPSKSPAGVPILFVPKPHGRGLRLSIDYPEITQVTIMNRGLHHSMNELRNRIQGVRVFTIINLKTGFHLVWVKHQDEWKTAFCTRYGLYEYTVMPFGPVNAPAILQDAMEIFFRDMHDGGHRIYMDDFSIYSATEEDHTHAVLEVLWWLKENDLAIAPDKCVWHASRVEILWYIISLEGIQMAVDKIKTILKWPKLECKQDRQMFLQLTNFYWRLFKRFVR